MSLEDRTAALRREVERKAEFTVEPVSPADVAFDLAAALATRMRETRAHLANVFDEQSGRGY